MAWLPDEQYEYFKDCKEKKSIAASAFKQRTHCGKGGSVKFPSDYLSKKELKAMSGECKTYRLNEPMSWDEFKSMPDDLKVRYIKWIREKFNAPDTAIMKMFGTSSRTLGLYFKDLGLCLGKGGRTTLKWSKDSFLAWCNGADPNAVNGETEEVVESIIDDIPEESTESKVIVEGTSVIEEKSESHCAIPVNGTMTFEGNVDDILRTVHMILNGKNVKLNVSWEVV